VSYSKELTTYWLHTHRQVAIIWTGDVLTKPTNTNICDDKLT